MHSCMNNIRRQLTLFVEETEAKQIEAIRDKFNPLQKMLIKCHVTICKENEIQELDRVIENLEHLEQPSFDIQFGQSTLFNNGKGILLPSIGDNFEFNSLRKMILSGTQNNLQVQIPHITLMHPRNSSCSNLDFETIKIILFPSKFNFKTISLIEQIDGEPWQIIKTFKLKNRVAKIHDVVI